VILFRGFGFQPMKSASAPFASWFADAPNHLQIYNWTMRRFLNGNKLPVQLTARGPCLLGFGRNI
jgi:hypothetical protein